MEEDRSSRGACCQSCPHRARAGDRWLLVSTSAQWLVILVCVVCIGVYLKQDHRTQETKDVRLYTETIAMDNPELKHGKAIPLRWRYGKRNVENGTLVVSEDGCYLLCLHGRLESDGDTALVKVYVKSNGAEPKSVLEGQMTNQMLNLLTLQKLLKGDSIYVEVAEKTKSSLNNLSLKLAFLLEIPLDEADSTVHQ